MTDNRYRYAIEIPQAIAALEIAYGKGNVIRVRRHLRCYSNGRQVARRPIKHGKAYL